MDNLLLEQNLKEFNRSRDQWFDRTGKLKELPGEELIQKMDQIIEGLTQEIQEYENKNC